MSQNENAIKPVDSPVKEGLAGLGSAFVTIGTTYPITKLIYRQILENENAAKSLTKLRQEGYVIVYRGIMPVMVQKCLCLPTMFAVYSAATIPLKSLNMNEYLEKTCASVISGTLEAFLMPFERVQLILLMSQYNNQFRNMFHLIRVMAKDYGFKEFFRGYTTILTRNICSNCCFFLTKSELQKRFDNADHVYMKHMQNFVYGALVGTLITVLMYPLKVAKVHIQKDLGGKYRNLLEVSREIYQTNSRGMINFYRGIEVNTLKGLLSWGITNSSYEWIKHRL
ncbi:hypothetical protein GWI33_013077 [Rhynchophorus ferrugineus]|uniref:Mitochondrial carrier protein n=1 Tax=Rhynchophorus ferrugineus TaxID=354439 RepID=A0A834I4F6_RHYFE|nr:hypothetical protein GWI33_013077 [Rhynchophorus ferrugineus]